MWTKPTSRILELLALSSPWKEDAARGWCREFDIQIEKRDEGETGAGYAWIVDGKLARGGKGLVEKTTSLPGNKWQQRREHSSHRPINSILKVIKPLGLQEMGGVFLEQISSHSSPETRLVAEWRTGFNQEHLVSNFMYIQLAGCMPVYEDNVMNYPGDDRKQEDGKIYASLS